QYYKLYSTSIKAVFRNFNSGWAQDRLGSPHPGTGVPREKHPEAVLLDSAFFRRDGDEKRAARSDPGHPGEPVAAAGAGGEPVLQLAPSYPRAVRGPRPAAVEAERRQPAPDAPLREPGDRRALRAG